jgi:hypothetical protein
MWPFKSRRFGVHEVKRGPFKGGLHHATKRYHAFKGELTYFLNYLSRRLLPSEPEESTMQGIILILQNLLEHELEALIARVVKSRGDGRDRKFQQRIVEGYVSFKTKYEWLRARGLIDQNAFDILEEVRVVRNALVHTRPAQGRRRVCYQGFPLLTQRSLRKLFLDVELTLRKIREPAGRSSRWMTVPPGYASELAWDQQALEGARTMGQVRGRVDDRGGEK